MTDKQTDTHFTIIYISSSSALSKPMALLYLMIFANSEFEIEIMTLFTKIILSMKTLTMIGLKV